jgi:hypothetical protein
MAAHLERMRSTGDRVQSSDFVQATSYVLSRWHMAYMAIPALSYTFPPTVDRIINWKRRTESFIAE